MSNAPSPNCFFMSYWGALWFWQADASTGTNVTADDYFSVTIPGTEKPKLFNNLMGWAVNGTPFTWSQADSDSGNTISLTGTATDLTIEATGSGSPLTAVMDLGTYAVLAISVALSIGNMPDAKADLKGAALEKILSAR